MLLLNFILFENKKLLLRVNSIYCEKKLKNSPNALVKEKKVESFLLYFWLKSLFTSIWSKLKVVETTLGFSMKW